MLHFKCDMPASNTALDSVEQRLHLNAFDTWQVLVIVKHSGAHLASNLYYLDTFQMYTKHADSLR